MIKRRSGARLAQQIFRGKFVAAAQNKLERNNAVQPAVPRFPDLSQASGRNTFQENERSNTLFGSTSENGRLRLSTRVGVV
jgi:hypothetical protein